MLGKNISNVSVDCEEKLFFKCKYNHEYVEKIQTLIDTNSFIHCPCCKDDKNISENKIFGNSSIMEKLIYYYVKQVFPNALNQYKCEIFHKQAELDILIKDLNIVIEHDGKQHMNPENIMNDSAKSAGLNCLKIDVIRIQHGFSHSICCDKTISYFPSSKESDFTGLNKAIKDMFEYIMSIRELSNEQIKMIKKLKIDCDKDKYIVYYMACEDFIHLNDISICQKVLGDEDKKNKQSENNKDGDTKKIKNSLLKNPRMAREFMSDKNQITPDKVATNSKVQYWFKCEKCGEEYKQAANKRNGIKGHC